MVTDSNTTEILVKDSLVTGDQKHRMTFSTLANIQTNKINHPWIVKIGKSLNSQQQLIAEPLLTLSVSMSTT